MSEFKLYKHKDQPSVRFWARPLFVGPDAEGNGPIVGDWEYEIRASRNAAFDTEDKPLFLCVPGGTFPAEFFEETYELVENPRVVMPA